MNEELNLRTAEECLEAVRQDGWALKYVPEDMKTPELCRAAVRQCGRALMFVLEDMKGKTGIGVGIGMFGIFSIMIIIVLHFI